MKPKSGSRGNSSSGAGARGTTSMLKHSDSSFGLHSPDALNDDVQVIQLTFFNLKISLKYCLISTNYPFIND